MNVSNWRYVLIGLAGIVAMGASATVFAADYINRPILALDNSVGLSYDYSHLHLTRAANPAYTLSGSLSGGRVVLSGMRTAGLPDLYMRVSYGETVGTPGASSGVATNARQTVAGLRLGQGFGVGRAVVLVPYFAGGFNRLATTTPTAPTFTQRNEYLGAGLMAQWAIWRRLVLGVNVAYARVVHPQEQVAGTSSAIGLGDAPWRRAGVSLDYRVGPGETVFASAAYTDYDYGSAPYESCVGGVCTATTAFSSHTTVMNYNLGVRLLY